MHTNDINTIYVENKTSNIEHLNCSNEHGKRTKVPIFHVRTGSLRCEEKEKKIRSVLSTRFSSYSFCVLHRSDMFFFEFLVFDSIGQHKTNILCFFFQELEPCRAITCLVRPAKSKTRSVCLCNLRRL